jgi:hypothetical protein
MDVDMDFQDLPTPHASGSRSWTDLIAGVRLAMDLPHNWSVTLRGGVGGFDFGIGDASEISRRKACSSRA